MKRIVDGDPLLIEYLIGGLTDTEKEEIERKYFSSDELFETLQELEIQLIDAYVTGRMEPELANKFESHYLFNPDRVRRVEFARALQSKADRVVSTVDAPPVSRVFGDWPRGYRWMAAALLILSAAGLWFGSEFIRLRNELARAQEENYRLVQQVDQSKQRTTDQASKIQDLKQELDQERITPDTAEPDPVPSTQPEPAILAVVLNPGMVRDSSSIRTLNLSASTHFVRFELRMDRDPFPSYRVSLQTVEGEEIWGLGLLKPRQHGSNKSIVFDLPAGRLGERDYVILLQGKANGTFADVGAYAIRTQRQ